MKRHLKLSLFFILSYTSLFSECATSQEYSYEQSQDCIQNDCCAPEATVHSHQFYIGPEIYGVHRNREGGTKQSGTVYAAKIGYDRFKRYRLYWGFEALYGQGTLTGRSGGEERNRLKSTFSDSWVEGRFGYTFQYKYGWKPSFTPFGGVGYFVERNNFKSPSPIPAHFKTTFWYAVGGFYSQITPCQQWDIGFNFKVKYLFDAQCKVTNDPEIDDFKQVINEKLHYRAELPITYRLSPCNDRWMVSLVPFYEFRQYGHHPNYPFDFYDTKFNIYGATLKLIYCL